LDCSKGDEGPHLRECEENNSQVMRYDSGRQNHKKKKINGKQQKTDVFDQKSNVR